MNAPGEMGFYNEAAGALLGRRFEETGAMSGTQWVETFGPLDADGVPIPIEHQPLTKALRRNRAAHEQHRIRSIHGDEHAVEVTGMPLIGTDGFQGAMICFWPTEDGAR